MGSRGCRIGAPTRRARRGYLIHRPRRGWRALLPFLSAWFLIGQPLLLLGFLLQERALIAVGAGFNAILGLGLVLGSIVQLPVALIAAPSAGIEEMSRLEILLAHVTAILSGATGTGLAAWTRKK